MTAINELLDNLLKYSYQLSCLNMRQVAADYDYFATWIQSKDPINPSKHYGVAPAGENTIAPLADNCPIPFIPTSQLVNNCTNKEYAVAYTSLINEILLTLKDEYTSDEEVTAINEYIKYTNNVIALLGGGSVIPPAQTLPTISIATYYTGNYVTKCYPGSFLNLYENAELVPYDSTKTHIARVSDGHGGWNEWQFSCIEYAGDIAIKNMTSDELSTYAACLFSCSSTQAEVIYVYNSSNEKYQAFKFTLNGTHYYYVADSIQNDWTDDLSSIGYSLEQITYTLSFTNTAYPDFAVSLPQAITENAGTEITLPSVSGSFEDEDYIYTPSAWSIGEFGSKFILNSNTNANLVWKSEEKQPSFVSDRFIDVTTKALALNPIPNYTPNGSFWIDNLSGRMPLSAYTTDTTQDYDFITSGYYDCESLSLNQSEIPTIIWLNAEAQYAPDSSVISALGLTDVINSEPEGSAMLRVITSISGGTLGNLTFGSITRVEYIKILFCDIVGYNEFGEDVNIIGFGFSVIFYRQSTVTDTFNVPEEDRFLVEENNETYIAYKTLIPANTVHINGALYDKPLIAEYGENTGLVIYEPTPYDLSVPPTPPTPTSLTAYFNVNNPGVNVSLFGSSNSSTQYNRLYDKDDSGSTSEISFDPSYTYTVLHVYKADGTEVLPSGGRFELGDSSNYLRLLFFNDGSSWVAAKIEYTKSSTEMIAYFNSGVKNNQKTVSSAWGTGGDQSATLYPLNSDKTIPFDQTKTYKIKTVFYKNNTNPVQVNDSQVSMDDLNYAGNHLGYLRVHTHVNNPATGDVCGCTYTVE